MKDREAIARVLNPLAMNFQGYNVYANRGREEALSKADQILALQGSSSDRVRELEEALETFIHAYRARYTRPSTGGIAANAPMRSEVAELNAAFVTRSALSLPSLEVVALSPVAVLEPPWPHGPENNCKIAGWRAFHDGKERDECPFSPARHDLQAGFREGWDAAAKTVAIDPAPAA